MVVASYYYTWAASSGIRRAFGSREACIKSNATTTGFATSAQCAMLRATRFRGGGGFVVVANELELASTIGGCFSNSIRWLLGSFGSITQVGCTSCPVLSSLSSPSLSESAYYAAQSPHHTPSTTPYKYN